MARKKTPIAFDYTLDCTALTHVSEEKDLGVIITSTLSWDSHIHTITAKANKLPGFLKQTCPLLTGVSIRRSLFLSLVKSQLCYATQVWSPAYVTLNAKYKGGTGAETCKQVDFTHARRRDVVQRAADFARMYECLSIHFILF